MKKNIQIDLDSSKANCTNWSVGRKGGQYS